MVGATVPVAVVGAGNMGRHHARNYHELEGADLRGIVDPEPARAEQLASLFGAPAFTSVEELLAAEPELAAASVVTPTTLHLDTAARLLEAGIHVLVEKPIAPTVEEADELIRLADTRGLVLAVGHVERFNPAVRTLKERIAAGDMGDVLSLIARRVGVMPPQVKDANVIVDLAVHDIDIFRYLLDAGFPEQLFCNAGRAIAQDRFDFADIFMRFDGAACLLQVNWVTPVKIRSLSVTGSKAYAELEYVTQELQLYRAQTIGETGSFHDVEAYSEREPEQVAVERAEPLARELSEFLRAVRGEDGEIVSGEEGRRSMEIALELVELVEQR